MYVLKVKNKKNDFLGSTFLEDWNAPKPYGWSPYINYRITMSHIPARSKVFKTAEKAQKELDRLNDYNSTFLSHLQPEIDFVKGLLSVTDAEAMSRLTAKGYNGHYRYDVHSTRQWLKYLEESEAQHKKFTALQFEPYKLSTAEMLRFDKRQRTCDISLTNITEFEQCCNTCGVLIPFNKAFTIRQYKVCPMCIKAFADSVKEDLDDIITNNKEYMDHYTAERVIQLL